MLFRDILVALPGLINPIGSQVRSSDTDIAPLDITATVVNGTAQTQAGTNPFMLANSDGTTNLRDIYEGLKVDIINPSLAQATPPQNGEGGDNPTTPGQPQEPAPEPLPLRLDNLSAEAGRVLTFTPAADGSITSITILSQGEHGHVSVNPDLSLSLVLSENPDQTGPLDFSYQITYADGRTQEVATQVTLTPGLQQDGWGQGALYMLEEDQAGNVIVEHGDNHRKVYVTEGDHGLTAAEIAKAEGLAVKDITVSWLKKHPEYGATADKALSTELGMKLWYGITGSSNAPGSHWLMFERGYEYSNAGRLINPGASGENALHPLLVTAYGTGADPVINSGVAIFQRDSFHVVLQGIDVQTVMALQGENLLMDGISVTAKSANIQNVTGFTLRNSDFLDIVQQDPARDLDYWHPSLNRTGGAFIKNVDGLLIENNLFDHNGWGDGYDYNLSALFPQAPSMYSHNLYIQDDVRDVTVRDNILMRGASFGAQVRPGGLIEDNVFLDNNAALNFLGGNYKNAGPVANYTLLLGNLITSAGHKRVAEKEGALSIGIDNGATQSSLIGNIVAHLADPANAVEFAEKTITHTALTAGKNTYFDDTIVYNWLASERGQSRSPNRNAEDLDRAVLDQTTIQNFTAALLGKDKATIADLANFLRAQASGKLDHVVDADLIINFFRAGFGLETDLRDQAQMLRFSPDDRGEGMRWDNRLNWSTDDLPGTQDGDSVNLAGNKVLFGAQTVTVDDFIFGRFGELKVTSGRLNIDGEISVANKTGADMTVDRSGQVWVDGYHDRGLLRLDVDGGRFANTGEFAGKIGMRVEGGAQAILATEGASLDLRRGDVLSVVGTKAKVGFDGATGDDAVLRLHDGSRLAFQSTKDGLGKISEFRSGALGETSDVTSGVKLDGSLRVNLTAWEAASPNKAASWTLIDVDQLIGRFDDLQVLGLSQGRDALLKVDYVKDEVTLLVSADGTGSGRVRMTTTGEADFIDYTRDPDLHQLWDSLHASLPLITDEPI